jgi:glycosyltransferase involved in cell wall biosynthesis
MLDQIVSDRVAGSVAERLRICMISREFPPETHLGGIGTYTYKTSAALARLGHDVHVITTAHKPAAIYQERGVTVHRIQEAVRGRYVPSSLAHARAVSSAIARIPVPFDVVQACEWGAEAFWYASMPWRKTPLVTRLATPLFVIERINEVTPSRGPRGGVVTRTLERAQTHLSDGIISPTRALARIVSEAWHIPPERITIVPTGSSQEAPAYHQDASLPGALQGSPYLLYFGRLERRKGVHILGEALPAVLEAHPTLRAVFVGEDVTLNGRPFAEIIRAHNAPYADRLIFLPRLPQRELFPMIRAAQVVVLPSLWENLANTCLEAMQLGRPVVATWGCGFEEVIEDGVSGALVPPGDVEALRDCLLSLLADDAPRARMGNAAEQRANAFRLDVMAARLADYYTTLVTTHHGAAPTGPRRSRLWSA